MDKILGLDVDAEIGEGEFAQSVVVVAEVMGADGTMRLGLHASRAAALAVEVELREDWEE